MASLSFSGAGHVQFGSQVLSLISGIVASSIVACLEAAESTTESERQFDELCRMSPEQLASLELTKSELLERFA